MRHIAVSLVRGTERFSVVVSADTDMQAERHAQSLGAPWKDARPDVWRREGYCGASSFEEAVTIAGRMERGARRWMAD